MQPRNITIYHSPDADDAFMFYGLTSGAINYPGFNFSHALKDIESLNQMARRGEIDVTAVSVHAYAYLSKDYVILNSGASMGGVDYGPRLVANQKIDLLDGKKRRIAIPGAMTSAALALRLYLAQKNIESDLVVIPFDEVQDAVRNNTVDCGVIIHEGQLTLEREGLVNILDLGVWWWNDHKLPLPLGVNIVKRALGQEAIKAVATVLKGTIEYSLAHREKALEYALSYGRGISLEDADKFVGMYVNELTVDLGNDGKRSIQLFLKLGAQCGIIPEVEIEFAA